MPTILTPAQDLTQYGPVKPGGLQAILEQSGRMPPLSIRITPLDPAREPVFLDRFLSYNFDSSIIVPVDAFTVSFAIPDGPAFNTLVQEGDIVTLYANNQPLMVGLVDDTEVEVDSEYGEKATISGRNLLAQLEDQDCISPTSGGQIAANNSNIDSVMQVLLESTRIPRSILKLSAPKNGYLFATEPGEKKLQALVRYLEPLNCLVWMSPSGQVTIGKPSQNAPESGLLLMSKSTRQSNCLDMKASRKASSVPNIILPIWSGQEQVQTRVPKEQFFYNKDQSADRLRRLGHLVPQTVVISTPQGATTQEHPATTDLIVASQQTTGSATSNLIQAYGQREAARRNRECLMVQAVVPGHYNENAQPYLIDQTYKVTFDRGDVDEVMYLYQVTYELDPERGPKTILYLCRRHFTLVADVRAI